MKRLITLAAIGVIGFIGGCNSDEHGDHNPPLNTAELQDPGHGNNGYSPTDPGRRGSVNGKFGPSTQPGFGTEPARPSSATPMPALPR